LFGQISDSTRTKWGRRIPYVAGFTLPLCIAFALLWMPPYPAGAEKSLFIWYFVVIFLFDGLFTIVVLNWTALFPEMYPKLEDRARVSALRQVLGIIGLIFGVALPPVLAERFGWRFVGISFGILGLVTMYASLYGAKERPEYAQEPSLPLVQALKETYLNKSFLTYVIPAMLIQYTFVALQAVIPFYTKYVLNASEFETTIFLGAMFVTAIPLAAVWGEAHIQARGEKIVHLLRRVVRSLPVALLDSQELHPRGDNSIVPGFWACGTLGAAGCSDSRRG
jgi:GPH family glycoside/pentoside/hexuronide:cation symporter